MAIDYNKFDKMVDMQGLQDDINAASENGGGNYVEVPNGTYEVKVEKMELTETGAKSKTPGMPMVSIWFKIVNGEYKDSLIFYNKVIMGTSNDGFMIHSNNELLRSLKSGLEVNFESYAKYAQLLLDIHEAIDGKQEYLLEYGSNKNGFKTYSISKVFDLK